MSYEREDYCPLNVAELLKKRGFRQDRGSYNHIPYYCEDGYLCEYDMRRSKRFHCRAVAPTLQMAMKWLRERHGIYIKVGVGEDVDGVFGYIPEIYILSNPITVEGRIIPSIPADLICDFTPKTYEQAVEASLLYALKNLECGGDE